MNNSNAPRIYLSGPMTGIKDFNYPAFNAEAARLRSLGYTVENPAENPDQSSWGDYMKVALRQMLTCDVIAVLPGWNGSRGARIEVEIAERVGMEFCEAAMLTERPFSTATQEFRREVMPMIIAATSPIVSLGIHGIEAGARPEVSIRWRGDGDS